MLTTESIIEAFERLKSVYPNVSMNLSFHGFTRYSDVDIMCDLHRWSEDDTNIERIWHLMLPMDCDGDALFNRAKEIIESYAEKD